MTSSTTCFAFLSNAFSDVRPIRGFGIFAAIIIPVNFLIVILVMPSVQIFHDRFLKKQFSYAKLYKKACKEKMDNQEETTKT